MPGSHFATLCNGESIAKADVPVLATEDFRRAVVSDVMRGDRIAAFFGMPGPGSSLRIIAALARDDQGDIGLCATDIGESYEALTPDCPQAHWFERELAEQWSIEPRGHPWLKPIRFGPPMRGPAGDTPSCGVTRFFQVKGDEIHEVAVGPVHAGVIEPGHFRFQCYGEEVLHLEISLGYQHRGIESALLRGQDKKTIHYIETLAGDSSVGHALAYCQAIEAIDRVNVTPRAMAIRGIALELERIANHIGDLGALAGDVGYLPAASFCGRIRGDVLNMTAVICGNRFGRSLVVPGGVGFDLTEDLTSKLLRRLDTAAADFGNVDRLLWDSPSVMARFEGVGAVPAEICAEIGLVGPPARACGMDRDVRKDHPFGIYRYAHIPTCTWGTGDVFGRAHIRSIEVQRSLAFIREQLGFLPQPSASSRVTASEECPVGRGDTVGPVRALSPDRLAVSLVEGWRGEVCHVAVTDMEGRFTRYKVVDPSFHNWFGLAYAMRGQQISDFPLCNKSFNLSYCGHDL
jgi:Ni,Fe-hydrogenase III large subunit